MRQIEAAERRRALPDEPSAYDSFAQSEAALLDRLAPEERMVGTAVPGQGCVGADKVTVPREVADYVPEFDAARGLISDLYGALFEPEADVVVLSGLTGELGSPDERHWEGADALERDQPGADAGPFFLVLPGVVHSEFYVMLLSRDRRRMYLYDEMHLSALTVNNREALQRLHVWLAGRIRRGAR